MELNSEKPDGISFKIFEMNKSLEQKNKQFQSFLNSFGNKITKPTEIANLLT